MACCGGQCGTNGGGGMGMAWVGAGVVAGAVVLIGVLGVGQPGEPGKPAPTPSPAPATTPAKEPEKKAEEPSAPKGPLEFEVQTIDGKKHDLSQHKGKVVIIVNVASNCGFTEQYAGLQAMYAKHKDEGLVVLGFPANDFMGQEPGTNLEIAQFCASKYSVTFPMFEKVSVKGESMHPLYKSLTSRPPPIGGEPKWNFTKFVIDRDGEVVARFDADRKYVRSKQLEPELVKKVEELLAAKASNATESSKPGAEPEKK